MLGFPSNSNNDPGECLYLGTDRGEAVRVVNNLGDYARQELYDLVNPQIRRHFPADIAAPAGKKVKAGK